ncbi:MAG: ankyrin repeat domain-containing protein [Gammaproteobacteria bacterium]|nr:MAG: ankyrin repeat domain-containing protein [Gammaproteobacteria bacterium]UTW41621.1 ankyrin repeat domain-containing protein [bacterium SCSIO 12844]
MSGKNELNTQLQRQLFFRDLNEAEKLISQGASINDVVNGETPLTFIAQYDFIQPSEEEPDEEETLITYPDIIRWMIEKKADVNKKNEFGLAPIHIAAKNGHKETLKILLQNGAHLYAKDNQGKTVFDYLLDAVFNDHAKVVELLLESGVDPNQRDKHGDTPLHYAASSGHIDIIELLLENGARINEQNNSGWSPLYLAAKNNQAEAIRVLLENETNLVKDNLGWTAVHVAANEGHIEALTALLEEFDPNIQGSNNETAIHISAFEGHAEAVELLIKYGADITLRDNGIRGSIGNTPRDYALEFGHFAIAKTLQQKLNNDLLSYAKEGDLDEVQKLLDAGANANYEEITQDGSIEDIKVFNTPLHAAVRAGSIETVKLLVSKGAKLNTQLFGNGPAPLHIAACFGHAEVAGLLIECGADITLRNNGGKTPRDYALEFDHVVIAEMLQQKLNNDLLLYAKEGNFDEVKKLLDAGANVNYEKIIQDGSIEDIKVFNTPLHAAVKSGSIETVKLLVSKGVELNTQLFGNGPTSLHYAYAFSKGKASEKYKEIVGVLLGAGADPDIRMDSGNKPQYLESQKIFSGMETKKSSSSLETGL